VDVQVGPEESGTRRLTLNFVGDSWHIKNIAVDTIGHDRQLIRCAFIMKTSRSLSNRLVMICPCTQRQTKRLEQPKLSRGIVIARIVGLAFIGQQPSEKTCKGLP
jgi:hypothetical protein